MTTKSKQAEVISIDIETVIQDEKRETFIKYNEPTKTFLTSLEKMKTDEERQKAIDEYYLEKSAFNPHYIRVVGLNWMELGGVPQSKWVGEEIYSTKSPDGSPTYVQEPNIITEDMLLQKFWQLSLRPKLIGANIVNFDIKTCIARSRQLDVRPLRDFSDSKPWDKDIIDIIAKMSPYGKFMSFKQLREIYLDKMEIPEKYIPILDMEGGSVAELWNNGDIETLKLYGEFDALTGIEFYKLGNGYWW